MLFFPHVCIHSLLLPMLTITPILLVVAVDALAIGYLDGDACTNKLSHTQTHNHSVDLARSGPVLHHIAMPLAGFSWFASAADHRTVSLHISGGNFGSNRDANAFVRLHWFANGTTKLEHGVISHEIHSIRRFHSNIGEQNVENLVQNSAISYACGCRKCCVHSFCFPLRNPCERKLMIDGFP